MGPSSELAIVANFTEWPSVTTDGPGELVPTPWSGGDRSSEVKGTSITERDHQILVGFVSPLKRKQRGIPEVDERDEEWHWLKHATSDEFGPEGKNNSEGLLLGDQVEQEYTTRVL